MTLKPSAMTTESDAASRLSGRLGTGSVVFMVIAAAAPLTVIAGNVPLSVGLGNGPVHRSDSSSRLPCSCSSRSASST